MARAGTAAARASALPRRAPQPLRRPPRPARRAAPPARLRPVERLAAIPHSAFVDRLLTGRGWIVLVGGLLAGIVFLNVSLLELNSGIARTTEQVAALKRENARLRLKAARLGSSERIQRAAAERGLVLPAPGEVRYLTARPAKDAARALARIRKPGPTTVALAPPPIPNPTPAPTQPAPASSQPVSTQPVPAQPAPAQQAPAEPAPAEPIPAQQAPATPVAAAGGGAPAG